MRPLVLFIMALFISLNGWALNFTVDGINYSTMRSTTVEVVRGNYFDAIIIPSTVVYSNVTYSVDAIGLFAFSGCIGLTSITIPPSVLSIESSAFSGCTGLTSITILSSDVSIGSSAFYGCSGLTSITIPPSVTSIGMYAFSGCKGLTSITFPPSVLSIGSSAFYGCSGLTSITIPSSVLVIGSDAFQGSTGLITVDTNNKQYSSKDGILYDKYLTGLLWCPISLKGSLDIPSSVKSIEGAAFQGCAGLTSITIPPSVMSIGFSSFSGCTGLKSITIPSSVKSFGSSVFSGCTGLTSITILSSISYIGFSSFSGCNSLTSITIPSSVISIENTAFSGCTGLTSITIPSSVTSIGYNAFQDCTGLTSINIPSSVTIIGDYAFSGCTGLASIELNATTPPWLFSEGVFDMVDKTKCILTVPMGSLYLYKNARFWEDFLTITESNPTGVSDVNLKKLIIYPSPALSYVNLELGESSNITDLIVFNSQGQRVYESQISNKQIQLDVSHFPSGLYFIKVKGIDNQHQRFGKFIKI
ncbi:MAG TPA: leucine-rich repeat domain-containing protein [Bacteroidales bacterium]|nr:leucine-rich repeat domain-containing protein [Bacteroidales bacterium]